VVESDEWKDYASGLSVFHNAIPAEGSESVMRLSNGLQRATIFFLSCHLLVQARTPFKQ
jgi:hypothetical protein